MQTDTSSEKVTGPDLTRAEDSKENDKKRPVGMMNAGGDGKIVKHFKQDGDGDDGEKGGNDLKGDLNPDQRPIGQLAITGTPATAN